MTSVISFTAAGVTVSLRFDNADSVLAVLQEILVGWQIEELPTSAAASDVAVAVRGEADRWCVSGGAIDRDTWFDDPVSTACSVVAGLLQARTATEQHFLCLHAAAVAVGDGLVVMPCPYRAGKSLLTAALAAAGQRIINDDVLLIDPDSGDGIAPGIMPRLRVPLPPGLDRRTGAFLEACSGPRGQHYRYLALPETLMARHGERAPIRGFVLLDRRDEGPAELTRIAPAAMLRQLIWQNFARAGLPERILETLADLVERTDCLQLTYCDLSEARDLLVNHFAGRTETLREGQPKRLCHDEAAASDESRLDLRSGDRLIRSEVACRFDRAGEVFLTTTADGSILHLNALASCLWTLLEQPLTYDEVLSTFGTAFPSREIAEIDRDLKAVLAAFKARGLVEVRKAPAARRRRKRGGLAAAALCGVLAGTGPAAATVIDGCEGRDISALFAPAASAQWRGEVKELASLRVAHSIALTCHDGVCRVAGGLSELSPLSSTAATERPRAAPTMSIASLPLGSAPPVQRREVTGADAAQLTRVLETRGYRDAAGDLRFVWVDYGRLAGQVNLRARSEIHCAAGKQACAISTAILAYVGYSERNPCPQFSAP